MSLANAFSPDAQALIKGFGDVLREAAECGRRTDSISVHDRPLNPMAQILGIENGVRFDSKSLRSDALAFTQRALGSRADATFTAMFARQLEYFYTWTADIEFPELRARQLIPVDTEVPSGADYFTYRMYDLAEKGSILHNYAKNSFPEADVFGDEFKQAIKAIGSKYSYSVQDMRAAAMSGVPLEAKKASSARYGIEKRLEQIAAYGDAGTNLYGITNAPSVNVGTKVSPVGTWLQQITAAIAAGTLPQTSQAIYEDVANMANTIFTSTLGIHKPTTLILPTPAYAVLATTPWSPVYRDESILQFLLKSSPWLEEIVDWPYLNALGEVSLGAQTWTVNPGSSPTHATASSTEAANANLLVAGNYISFSSQPGVQYKIASFNGTTLVVLTTAYTGTNTSTATASIQSGLAMVYEKNPRCLQLVIPQEFEQFPPMMDGLLWEVYCHMRTGGVNYIRPLSGCTLSGVS